TTELHHHHTTAEPTTTQPNHHHESATTMEPTTHHPSYHRRQSNPSSHKPNTTEPPPLRATTSKHCRTPPPSLSHKPTTIHFHGTLLLRLSLSLDETKQPPSSPLSMPEKTLPLSLFLFLPPVRNPSVLSHHRTSVTAIITISGLLFSTFSVQSFATSVTTGVASVSPCSLTTTHPLPESHRRLP
ncbi:hypothetical protein PIB30_102300, partial [Stylosanthes scabra]|nr:hypothetical protein [Stylosanthes scabra]